MDTIESIKAALNEWTAEDPSRRYSLLRDPALSKVLARATELQQQNRRLILERYALEDHLAIVDQAELILGEGEGSL